MKLEWVSAAAVVALVAGCEGMIPKERPVSSGHVSTTTPAPAAPSIPSPVSRVPVVPVPEPAPPVETYTVVVNDVPVKELLFALARDAAVNVDIHREVEGNVTLNAVDQSLIQILNRISRQIDLRYEMRGDSIVIGPDRPFLRTYTVDYVNMARNTTNTVKVSTGVIASQIGGAGGGESGGGGSSGGANSETNVDSVSNNEFWQTLTETVTRMIAGDQATRDGATFVAEEAVIPNQEAGILVVRATARQHEEIRRYLDQVLVNSKRQVLIEATIVEVELSDAYQAGIDWARVAQGAGFAIAQSVVTGGFGAFGAFALFEQALGPTASLEYANSRNALGEPNGKIDLTVRLLKSFGNTRVLSSPKIMTLNNQTAMLQVVENVVYFEVKSQTSTVVNAGTDISSETTARTVPVGVIMAVTPQIDGADQVILNVRPTISRITDFVNDPNPTLAANELTNPVPQIAVREMESIMRVGSGQIAVLGGLMQDQRVTETDDVPVLSEAPAIGEAFRFRDQELVKTELVIFMRPWVIRSPDVRTDLVAFQPFLPENQQAAEPARTPIGEQLNPPPAGAPVN
jgi:general secretion pathway protein D